MKMLRKWKYIFFILCGMIGLSTMSFNCSPSLFEAAKGNGSSSSSSFGSSSLYEETNAPIVLLTAEQTYQSMLNVTGQTTSAPARTEYLSRFGMMSATDSLTNMNSPLLLASTSLGGDVCGSLVNKEKAVSTRTFFAGVDFNSGPDGQQTAFTNSVNSMASSFWGRSPSNEELTTLNAFFEDMKQAGPGSGKQPRDLTAAIFVGACAAMVSSFDALVY